MIDIHTHLHFKDYDADQDAVIERARAAGVEKMILVGTDLESSRAAVELAEQYEFLFASVGVHPHEFAEQPSPPSSPFRKGEVSSLRDGGVGELIGNIAPQSVGTDSSPFRKGEQEIWIEKLQELAKHPKVVAIGECGLDYFSRDPERSVTDGQKTIQKEGFLAQMDIAKERGLPMIIHTRPSAGTMDAYEDIFEIVESHSFTPQSQSLDSSPQRGEQEKEMSYILHCYQGDTDITKKFLDIPSVYFSFAGNVTYPVKKTLSGTKDDIREVVKLVPITRMFVETDCPYLSPQERRGERNEPAFSLLTAEKLAFLKGEDPVSSLDERVSRIFGF